MPWLEIRVLLLNAVNNAVNNHDRVIYFLYHGPRPVPVDELFHDCRSGIIQIPLTATENIGNFLLLWRPLWFLFESGGRNNSKTPKSCCQGVNFRSMILVPIFYWINLANILKHMPMVYKALNSLVPNYLAQMFTGRRRITYYTLRDTSDK